MGNVYHKNRRPEYIPASEEPPSFPPEYGFDAPRKERVMKISEQEMKALRIPVHLRDYCAHLLPEYYMCRREKAPFFKLCQPELHKYKTCQYEDYIMRMKEYEREKRLRIRELKLQGKAVA